MSDTHSRVDGATVPNQFAILHVCTGNIGRSPIAERLMTSQLVGRLSDRASSFDVSSAGTFGCVGAGMEPYSEAVLRERGVGAAGFVARELTVEMVNRAGLVLTATREHRTRVVSLVPAAVRRSFTLKEFAGLAELVRDAELVPDRKRGSDVELRAAAHARVDLAGRVRGMGNAMMAEDFDIEDPFGASLSFYAARAAEIDQACGRAVDLLLGLDHQSGADRWSSPDH